MHCLLLILLFLFLSHLFHTATRFTVYWISRESPIIQKCTACRLLSIKCALWPWEGTRITTQSMLLINPISCWSTAGEQQAVVETLNCSCEPLCNGGGGLKVWDMAGSTWSSQSLMSTCLSLHSPLTSFSLPLLSDEEILSGEPQTPGLGLSSLRMCLNCEHEKGGGGRGGGGGVVVKVGEGAYSSHAGGIIFYPLNWKTFQRKCVGGFGWWMSNLRAE